MRGLYLVTPNWDDTERMLVATDAALAAGAALVQYRHKDAGEALRAEQAAALLTLCRRHGTPLVINDHIELCAALDADGVHLGHTDQGIADARALLGRDKIVGASCYGELALARAAQENGASYVAFGGFYPSPVKKYTFVTPPERLDEAVQRQLALLDSRSQWKVRQVAAERRVLVNELTYSYRFLSQFARSTEAGSSRITSERAW